MHTLATLLAIAAAAVTLRYIWRCLVSPYWGTCWRCRPGGANRTCRACKGTGMRSRLIWRAYTYARRLHHDGTRNPTERTPTRWYQ